MDYLSDGVLVYLNHLVDWEPYFERRKGGGVDVEAERAAMLEILRTCAELCAELEPESRACWDAEAVLVDKEVVLPPHIVRGYERFASAGLVSLTVEEAYGGFALPQLISNVILQMLARMNLGLQTVIGLQMGVADDIQSFASEELCREYLPRFASGELQGAMDLTEPHAGSDLGAITTRAEERDGRFFVSGQKIFITNGGCDIHLVLAREADTFDASKGTTNGLSLFIVPKTLPDGSRNAFYVERLEEKWGLHGSATCAVRFEDAEGFRIAEKGRGFRAMLQLMNHARLGVAAQGIGIAEAALEEALQYAKTRKQFGKPIAEQPLMKSMLSRMVLAIEGSRALLYRCCTLVDRNTAIERYLAREGDALSEAERGDLEGQHSRNQTRIRLLTPLAKYLATESCDQVTRMAIQVHGGLGFMKETNVGKLHLDGIITTIYEGTSEIQVSFALKEIGRGALDIVFDELRDELEKLTDAAGAELAARVRGGIDRIQEVSPALMQDFNYALMCARLVAEMVIVVIVGTELLGQAAAAPARMDLAASWINRKILELEAHATRVEQGGVERIERCERVLALAQR